MKKLTFAILIVLFLMNVIMIVAQAKDEKPPPPPPPTVPLTISNNTPLPVLLWLSGERSPRYAFSVAPRGEVTIRILEAERYSHTTVACGQTAFGTLSAFKGLYLRFTPCYSPAPNAGETHRLKVHFFDQPENPQAAYRYR